MPTTTRAPRVLNQAPEAIAWARNAKRWTQRQLADAAGISYSHMSEIEGGTRSARPAVLDCIALALNCPVSMLERKREAA